MSRRHAARASSALITILCATTAVAAQSTQSVTIAGHAVDPQGRPMAGLEVLLHRVDGAGGASLGSATTDSTGAFSISAGATADTSAVYFAAARFGGQLYIGPFLRDPDGTTPYRLEVGGQPVSLGPVSPTTMPPVSPAPGPRRQLLVLLPLIGLLGVAGWSIARGARPPARRRALIRIAALDEEIADVGDDPRLRTERERLMERLLSD